MENVYIGELTVLEKKQAFGLRESGAAAQSSRVLLEVGELWARTQQRSLREHHWWMLRLLLPWPLPAAVTLEVFRSTDCWAVFTSLRK